MIMEGVSMGSFVVEKPKRNELQMFEALEKTNRWLNENLDDIIKENEGKFVAVTEGKILASNKDLDKLHAELDKKKLLHAVGITIIKASREAFRSVL